MPYPGTWQWFDQLKTYVFWAPPVMLVGLETILSIVISIINHIYWSYVHQLSDLKSTINPMNPPISLWFSYDFIVNGAPLCMEHSSRVDVSDRGTGDCQSWMSRSKGEAFGDE